jgi:SAM-dependent methyltransferase
MKSLTYTPLERLFVKRPVGRSRFVTERCKGRVVLDLGCRDETALVKCDTPHWLHAEIIKVAKEVVGVDLAEDIPAEGMVTGPHSRVLRGDVNRLEEVVRDQKFEVVVAGELLEHLPDPLAFLRQLRRLYAGCELLLTTPNATALSNVVLALASRESNHHDHLGVFSIKTLNTLCLRAGFQDWEIVPYHVYFTEMIFRLHGAPRLLVQTAERMVNWGEWLFPMLSGGLILHVRSM